MTTKRSNDQRRPKFGFVAETIDGHRREKDFLTLEEMTRLLAGAKGGRHGIRDHALVMMMFRHGLRVSELTGMLRSDVHLADAKVWVRRLKGSDPAMHPIEGDELRAIKRYLATRTDNLPWMFLSERGTQLRRTSIAYLIDAAAERAGLPHVNPHMMRHSCGYYLCDKDIDSRTVQAYLGHRNPASTAHYSRLSKRRFDGIFNKPGMWK